MKKINYLDCPCEIHGIPFYKKGNKIQRLPDYLLDKLPNLKELALHPAGTRLCFRTDTNTLKIRIKLDNVYVDRGMSFYQANVATIFVGERKNSKFYGILSADKSYDENEVYGTFSLPEGTNEITVFLPRNPTVLDIDIEIDEDASVFAPTPYSFGKPIIFYGSSITENGHTSSQNAYNALISRCFDADYYNLGFSGSARGEKEMAEFISDIDCSIFVYDYDHNAPSAEHLRNTHEPFFKLYREFNPYTPVIMMTKPHDDFSDTSERREIIYNTYLNARNNGDDNVYFIDGLSFFPESLEPVCTTDRTHPNDLGHFFMAEKLKEVINEIIR